MSPQQFSVASSLILATVTNQRLIVEKLDTQQYRQRMTEPCCGTEYHLVLDSFLWELGTPGSKVYGWVKQTNSHKRWSWRQRRAFKTMIRRMKKDVPQESRHFINTLNVQLASLGIENIRVLPEVGSGYHFFALAEIQLQTNEQAHAARCSSISGKGDETYPMNLVASNKKRRKSTTMSLISLDDALLPMPELQREEEQPNVPQGPVETWEFWAKKLPGAWGPETPITPEATAAAAEPEPFVARGWNAEDPAKVEFSAWMQRHHIPPYSKVDMYYRRPMGRRSRPRLPGGWFTYSDDDGKPPPPPPFKFERRRSGLRMPGEFPAEFTHPHRKKFEFPAVIGEMPHVPGAYVEEPRWSAYKPPVRQRAPGMAYKQVMPGHWDEDFF
ncbi:hypothetical protein B0T10DRAFT_552716 [Thelonectria olida]|uniref:Uncharacterized protein n=1 Tax=Thelonectria olida TaxID=1576542 RepID=A0A9P8VVU6_9HYPO|nr:hypothetical protein B0T10DRAFT_552716 [Thelonectria olida]